MTILAIVKNVAWANPWALQCALIAISIVYLLYCIFLHPLRKLPGPFFCKAIPGWIAYHAFRDTIREASLHAHETYGDVVCVGPRKVLARSPEAVTKVTGYGANHLSKSPDYGALVFHTPSVFSETNNQAHSRKRRIAAQAYSMNSILRMEQFVDLNVELFVTKLESCALSGQALDLCEWFKFYAFDVIGDLAFGRSFGMMERGDTGEFVTKISEGIEYTFVLFLLPSFLRPIRRFLSRWTLPRLEGSKAGFDYVRRETIEIVSSRWQRHHAEGRSERADILGALMDAKDPQTHEKMGFQELATNASTNVVAGSDTLTIALTAIAYHVLQNPTSVQKLVAELDAAIAKGTPAAKELLGLPYLDACVKEAMRMLAPFGGPMPRLSPRGGLQISDKHIPEGTSICVMHDGVHFDERVYPNATTFQPERWSDGKTEDMERCFLGFSTGPRSCLGKNIALLEMKRLLLRLFTEYDLTLVEPLAELRCRRFLVTKSLSPLLVRVTHRKLIAAP